MCGEKQTIDLLLENLQNAINDLSESQQIYFFEWIERHTQGNVNADNFENIILNLSPEDAMRKTFFIHAEIQWVKHNFHVAFIRR
jgi:hypothetical protein